MTVYVVVYLLGYQQHCQQAAAYACAVAAAACQQQGVGGGPNVNGASNGQQQQSVDAAAATAAATAAMYYNAAAATAMPLYNVAIDPTTGSIYTAESLEHAPTLLPPPQPVTEVRNIIIIKKKEFYNVSNFDI